MVWLDHKNTRAELYAYFKQIFTGNLPQDEVLKYVMLNERGKLSRPLMLIQTARAYQARVDPFPHATAIECIHRGSLMYDDLPSQDNSEERHGEPTCWKYFENKWPNRGVAATELAANLLMGTCPIELVDKSDAQPLQKEKIRANLTIVARHLSAGQYLDLHIGRDKRKKMTLRQRTKMCRLKTGSLYVTAASNGAILGDAPEEDLDHIAIFGNALGVAYQLVDDWNDRFGDPKQLGKPVKQDQGKGSSLGYLLSESQIRKRIDRYRRRAIEELRVCSVDLEKLVQIAERITQVPER